MAKIMFDIGAKLDKQTIDGVQKQLTEAKKRLKHIIQMDGKDLIDETDVLQEIDKVSKAMEVSFRDSLGKLDTTQFKKQLKEAGVDINKFGHKLKEVVDVEGTESFRNLTKEVQRTEVQLKKTKNQLDKAFETFTKTAYWSVANKGVQAIGDSVQRAIGYTKALDESLNNIRVVTGKSDAEMVKFANDANKAAKALGRTTTDYTDGALLYLQQGKSMSEAAELTKQTLIAANITGQDTAETANMLTAALNGYNLAAEDAARVTDIFANVGAKSGADFRELATGFSRVASMGKTVGVSFEQLTAQIATISTVTREAPESIGNALKTVYSRMSQIKLEGKVDDEDGVTYTLGNVERALSTIGLSVKDENNNLRDMGEVLEEVGGKWETLSKEQKSAVTEALAGTRQANKLIALFNQWPMYMEQLTNAENASGAAAEQNEIRMDSLQARANKLKATLEDLYSRLKIDDILKVGITGLTSLIEKVNELIDSFGGIEKVAVVIGGVLAGVFSTHISSSVMDISNAVGKLGTTFAALSGNKKLANMAGMDSSQAKEYKQQYKASKALQPDEFEEYKDLSKKKSGLASNTETQQKKVDYEKAALENIKKQVKAQDEKANLAFKEKQAARDKLNQLLKEKQEEEEILEIKKKQLETEEKKKKGKQDKGKVKKAKGAVDESEKKLSEKDAEIEAAQEAYEKAAKKTSRAEKKRKGSTEARQAQEAELEGSKKKLKEYSKELDETNEKVDKFDNKIKLIDKGKLAIGVLSGITVAITGAIGAFNQYKDAALDYNAQTDAMVSGINSLGAGLMALPGPWFKVAGAITMATGAAIGWVRENTGMGKVIKTNQAAIESYNKTTSGLKSDIRNLTEAQGKLNRMQAIADSGIDNTNREEYLSIQNEIATIMPELVSHYDSEGNAVVKLTTNVKGLIEAKKEQLKIANQTMVGNQSSFGLEYGMILSKGESMVASQQSQIKDLQTKSLTEGLSDKEAEKLEKLQVQYQETVANISNASQNIRDNIVQPFLDSDDVISNLNPKLQGIAAELYSVDTISKKLEVGYKLWDATKGAYSLDSALDDAKVPAQQLGLALANIEKKAINSTGAEAKKANQLLTVIENMDEAAKKLSRNLTMKFKLDAVQAEQMLTTIASYINPETGIINFKKFSAEFGNAFKTIADNQKKTIDDQIKLLEQNEKRTKKVLDFEDLKVKAIEKSNQKYKEQVAIIEEEVEAGNKGKIRKAKELTGEWYAEDAYKVIEERRKAAEAEIKALTQDSFKDETYTTYGTGYAAKDQAPVTKTRESEASKKYSQTFSDIQTEYGTEEVVDNQAEINRLKLEQAQIDERLANYQNEINKMMEDYMFDLADTPEGYNALVDQYEALNTVIGETGEAIKVNLSDALDSVDVDGFFVSFSEEIESLKEQFSDIVNPEELQEKLDEYQGNFISTFENMSDASKDAYLEMGIDINKLVVDAKSENKDLSDSALDTLSKAHNKMNKEAGKLYAALNKDNARYFSQVKKSNKAQVADVARVTGIMADDYATLAEYKGALDQWQADNAAVLASDEASAVLFWANNALDGVRDINKDGDISAEESMIARSNSAKAASYAQIIAQGEAEIEKNTVMAKGLNDYADSVGGSDNPITQAAADAARQEAAKLTANVAGIQAVIDDAKQKIKDIVGNAGGDTSGMPETKTKTDGYVPPQNRKPSINTDWNLGGGSTSKKPLPEKPIVENKDPLGGGDDKGGGGGSDKGSEPETVEDIEDKVDVYRDVETALKEIGRLTTEQVDRERDMYGETKLASMQKRLNLLKQEVEWEKKRQEIAKGELKRISGEIAGTKAGVEFDKETGVIKNYNQILQGQIDAINAIADTEVDAKNAAIERYETLKALMEEYESHLEVLRSSEDTLRQKRREISDRELEKLDYKVQVELDMTTLERQTEEFLIKLGDGMGTASEKFFNSSERFSGTLKMLDGSLNDIKSMQSHIADIQASTDLTPEAKLEELKKSREEMIKFYESALKYRQELEKIKQDAYKEAGKQVADHLKQFDDINKELKSMMDILKLTGEMDDVETVNAMYDLQSKSLDSQLTAAIKSRDMLQEQLSALEEGTEEWKVMNAEVKKLDEQILKITQESLKLYQDQLKYTVDNVLKDLEKNLTSGNSFKEIDKELKKQQQEKKEYLSTTEKILQVSKLQKKVEQEISKATDPAVRKQLQDFLENDLALLKEKDKLTHYDMERAEKMLNITMKQIALDNARNNKTMMRLVRTSTGGWAYQYVADAEKVEKAQQDLSSSLADLLEFDQKRQEEVQKNMLEAKKDFYKELEEIMKAALNGEYETQEEFNEAIAKAEEEFGLKMEDLTASMNTVNQNLTESTLAAILDAYKGNHNSIGILTKEEEAFFESLGKTTTNIWETVKTVLDGINEDNAESFKDKFAGIVDGDATSLFESLKKTFGNIDGEWNTSVNKMITDNTNLKTDVTSATSALKTAWEEYSIKVEAVTKKSNTDFQGMKDRIDNLTTSQEKAAIATDKLVGSIEDELNALAGVDFSNIINEYQKLIQKAKDYIQTLNDMIRMQQQAMGGDKKPGTEIPPAGGGKDEQPGGSGGGGGGGPQGNGIIDIGDKVKVKTASASAWYTSDGTKVAPWKEQASAVGKKWDDDFYVYNTSKNRVALSSKKGEMALAWLDKDSIIGFDTGGYTGDWSGKDGKMAMLHQKEIILNKDDTQNILEAVKIMRSSILGSASYGGYGGGNSNSNLQQQITINAEFPNVKVSNEIEKAFSNMANTASQYASRIVR